MGSCLFRCKAQDFPIRLLVLAHKKINKDSSDFSFLKAMLLRKRPFEISFSSAALYVWYELDALWSKCSISLHYHSFLQLVCEFLEYLTQYLRLSRSYSRSRESYACNNMSLYYSMCVYIYIIWSRRVLYIYISIAVSLYIYWRLL